MLARRRRAPADATAGATAAWPPPSTPAAERSSRTARRSTPTVRSPSAAAGSSTLADAVRDARRRSSTRPRFAAGARAFVDGLRRATARIQRGLRLQVVPLHRRLPGHGRRGPAHRRRRRRRAGHRARRRGDPASIVLHGNAKTDDELEPRRRAGVGTIVVDGWDDIDAARARMRLRPAAGAAAGDPRGRRADPGRDLHRAPRLEVRPLPRRGAHAPSTDMRASDRFEVRGLHLHIGSQILDRRAFAEAVEAVAGLGDVRRVRRRRRTRRPLHRTTRHPPSVEEYLDTITAAAADAPAADAAQLWIEPGRSLVAQSAVTLYRVVTVKRGDPTFVAVDGGIADNLEASTYVGHPVRRRRSPTGSGRRLARRAGRPAVRVRRPVRLRPAAARTRRSGDVVAVPMTGAYTYTLAQQLQRCPAPAGASSSRRIGRPRTPRDVRAHRARRGASRRPDLTPTSTGPAPHGAARPVALPRRLRPGWPRGSSCRRRRRASGRSRRTRPAMQKKATAAAISAGSPIRRIGVRSPYSSSCEQRRRRPDPARGHGVAGDAGRRRSRPPSPG